MSGAKRTRSIEKVLPCQCCLTNARSDPSVDYVAHLRIVDACFSIQVPLERCADGTRPILCKRCIKRLKECQRFMATIENSQFALQTTRLMDTAAKSKSTNHDYCQDDAPVISHGELSSPGTTEEAPTEVKLECEMCTGMFPSKTIFMAHLKECQNNQYHMMEDQFECNMCSKTFTSKVIFAAHLKKCKKCDRKNQYECNLCSETFTSIVMFTAHLKECQKSHCDIKNQYECDTCSEIFPSKVIFTKHVKGCQKSQGDTKDEYECNKCGGKSIPEADYKLHIRVHDSLDQIGYFQCEICTGKCYNLQHFSSHMENHKNPVIAPVRNVGYRKCDLCGKVIASAGFKRHQDAHAGRKVFRCPVHGCDERFSIIDARFRHMRDAHALQIDRYPCKECPKVYHRLGLLNRHVKNFHREKVLDSTCEVCGYRCTGRFLKDHMVMHTGERVFKCAACDKAFLRKKNLEQHAMIHLGIKRRLPRVPKT